MTIEGQLRLFGNIPVFKKMEFEAGTPLPSKISFDPKVVIDGLRIMPFVSDGDEETRIIDNHTLSVYKNGERVLISGEEINQCDLKCPTYVPGLKLHLSYKPDPTTIVLAAREYKVLSNHKRVR